MAVALIILLGGCALSGFDRSLKLITKPYRFSILRWELTTLFSSSGEEKAQGGSVVEEYFALVEEIESLKSKLREVKSGGEDGELALLKLKIERLRERREALAPGVESVLSRQIKEVLAKEGIFNPFECYLRLKVNFPPVKFRLDKPPKLLVISPRERIESLREILLKQDLSLKEMEEIEERADKLGVSSLVVDLGGLAATYPSFVSAESSLKHVIETAVEEWVHQYLAFTPLGFSYLLDLSGLRRNYEVATINETVASMISKEIRAIICKEYYPQCQEEGEERVEEEFDFNREMREIRKKVDEYLSKGEVRKAERFMEWKREYLVSKGYYIRKLNQAYFAFHGTYADRPTSISPIGGELKQLREQSASLRDFLHTVSRITSRKELSSSLTRD